LNGAGGAREWCREHCRAGILQEFASSHVDLPMRCSAVARRFTRRPEPAAMFRTHRNLKCGALQLPYRRISCAYVITFDDTAQMTRMLAIATIKKFA
jgi:hypothetical protein